MIKSEKRYDFITQQIRYTNEKIFDSFKFFMKLATAIIGGLFYILIQNIDTKLKSIIITFSPWLLTLVGLLSILLILIKLRAWYGYRKAESILTEYKAPLPKGFRSFSSEFFMISSIIICILLFWLFVNKYLSCII